MIQGKTIVELANELQRQQESKKDYIADTRAIKMQANEGRITLDGLNGNDYGIGSIAHEQIGARLAIPKKYYDRMLAEDPGLLATNVNTWFAKNPERRMVRTLDGNARAFLSDRFRPLDNFDLAEAVLPKIQEMGCQVESSEITEKRMYLKCVTPRVQTEIRKGDIVQAGICISNSEVGHGSLRVEPLILRLVCMNGMIANDHALRKYHVGRNAWDALDEAVQFYSEKTLLADNRAFFMKVKDIVAAALTFATFDIIVNKMRTAAEQKMTGNPVAAVEVFANKFAIADGEKNGILKHLAEGGDFTKYGLLNAVTRTAQDAADYDRSTELEKLGGDVLEMPTMAWREIAEATA